jgi:mercuric ion binding protein
MKKNINVPLVLFFTVLIVFSSSSLRSQDTLTLRTSVICGMCKSKVETELGYVRGVRKVEVDLMARQVNIVYQARKISAQRLREILSEVGYDADEIKAKKEAYDQLPACCRKETTHH